MQVAAESRASLVTPPPHKVNIVESRAMNSPLIFVVITHFLEVFHVLHFCFVVGVLFRMKKWIILTVLRPRAYLWNIREVDESPVNHRARLNAHVVSNRW